MKLIHQKEASPAIWEEAWKIYESSFPGYERRSRNSHTEVVLNEDEFYPILAVGDNGEFLALLFYWKHENLVYVEHLAVNPALRGRNIGSQVLQKLIDENPDRTVMLEIDPPVDEISIRRLHFYERLGFLRNSYDDYVHPSYTKMGHPHSLVVMSHGRIIEEAELSSFKDFLFALLARYAD